MRSSPRGVLAAALLGVVAAVVLGAGSPARAHNELVTVTPTHGSELSAVPGTVTLRFSEPLKPEFTQVSVTVDGDRSAVSGGPEVTGQTVTQALAADAPAGSYTVGYRVISADGHPVEGAVRFTVLPASPGNAPEADGAAAGGDAPPSAASGSVTEAEPLNRAANTASGSAGAPPWLWGGAAALALVVAVGVWWGVRRRQT